ncbi:hypothetical protein GCM10009850_048510 [Nonomuraea monospora]|uniref:Uncharacterized protein n=1 Tax=Nonomuraea monospora TaxID=568818 RepID=A0ABN3CIY9_9ACTN
MDGIDDSMSRGSGEQGQTARHDGGAEDTAGREEHGTSWVTVKNNPRLATQGSGSVTLGLRKVLGVLDNHGAGS